MFRPPDFLGSAAFFYLVWGKIRVYYEIGNQKKITFARVKRENTMESITHYISALQPEFQSRMNTIRSIVKEMAPDAVEKISYQMPSFYLNNRPLVYYASFKTHIGFYPIPSGLEAFKDELKGFKQGKGSVQFPINQPLPIELIKRIVAYRIGENRAAGR